LISSFAEISRAVRDHLGQDRRFAHSVRVARLADRLAQRHAESTTRARLAGMLHDLARLYSAERLLQEAAQRALPLDAFERRNPIVVHARIGAEIAREKFGVQDPAVLDAIRRHTVAAPTMSRLDAILYLADGLEPGRTFAERAALEALAMHDLDAAMLALLRSTLDYLHTRGLDAAPQTIAAIQTYEALERSPALCPS
ncbi:MAG: bis(5'-nucleosyl)-tetraphosphatase (symmetrical) YqeK, partial [Candidatus Eremiobacteraeota bacterium]|nr:bis(5'-nucleosyl)-tetraphosphatase (symmetrical) YqeK [Candidatus Eremiobacteraeota bacterium]